MKHSTLIFLTLVGLLLPPASDVRAESLPMFTHDFYVADASHWLNKEVTLSVSFLKPPEEAGLTVPDMVLLTAHTFHNHQFGGLMTLAAPKEVADRLKQQCGVQVQRNAGFVHTTQLHGTFKEKDGHYYMQIDK